MDEINFHLPFGIFNVVYQRYLVWYVVNGMALWKNFNMRWFVTTATFWWDIFASAPGLFTAESGEREALEETIFVIEENKTFNTEYPVIIVKPTNLWWCLMLWRQTLSLLTSAIVPATPTVNVKNVVRAILYVALLIPSVNEVGCNWWSCTSWGQGRDNVGLLTSAPNGRRIFPGPLEACFCDEAIERH